MIGAVIGGFASTQPHRPALVSTGKTPLSYAELHRQIEDIGQQLLQGGFTSQSRIGVALLDGPEAILIILAVASHAAAVPINNSLSADELRQLFEQAELQGIVIGPTTAPHIRKVARDVGITVIEGTLGRPTEIACAVRVPAKAGATASSPRPESIALILTTSGTTGRPKLVPITHNNLISEATKLRNWFKLTPDDRCLSALPLYYAHGLREVLFPPILTGGSIARAADYTKVDVAEWFTALEPTWYSTFPIFHRAIDELLTTQGAPAHKLRFVLSAGTALKPELQQSLERQLDVPVLEFYGVGECGHMTANLPMPGRHKPGTCGVPLPGDIMIARDGTAVAAGELGEVLVRGQTVISGYLNSPEVNREAFVDGWFRTGDLGVFDPDGFLSIHGRYKELISRGGEKLSPIEVEQALLRHPAVAEAAAFAVPHPRLGEDVAAAVVLREATSASPSELQQFARGQLTPFKVPRIITVVRELPKDVTGKVQRRELAASLATVIAAAPAAGPQEPSCPLTADLMQLWRNLLQCESIGLDDDFFDKGGDSLLAVQMRLSVEKMTGLTLPGSMPFDAPTIRQFVQAVGECQQASPMPLIVEHSKGAGRPLFFFHGDYLSGGHYVRQFSELLAGAARIFSVAPHGLTREPIPASIRQMAADRLHLILAVQPAGPFYLGGHCNGGAVALETARLLRNAGHQVELVALIDTPTMNASPAMQLLRLVLAGGVHVVAGDAARRDALMAAAMKFVWRLCEKHRRVWQMEPTKRRARIAGKLRRWGRSLLAFGGQTDTAPSAENELMDRTRRHFMALAAYFPRPLDVPVVCYCADHSGHHLAHMTPLLEIVEIPTDHFGCVTTHMRMIADHLRARLSDPSGRKATIDPETADPGDSEAEIGPAPVYTRAQV